MRRAIPIVFLVLCGAGCKRTLHWKAIEDQLAASLTKPGTVSCPETAVEVGLKFRCHVTANDGDQLDVEITLRDLNGSYESHPVH